MVTVTVTVQHAPAVAHSGCHLSMPYMILLDRGLILEGLRMPTTFSSLLLIGISEPVSAPTTPPS